MSIRRRKFLAATTAAAGTTLVGRAQAQQKPKSKPKRATSKSPDFRVAVIGVKSRGLHHINGLSKHLVGLCDVDSKILDDRTKRVEDKIDRKILKFTDYRKLVESDEIDAVSIATPNHTHCLIAIAACAAGKDVYCEKPVSHNVWEGRQLVNAAARYERIVQCGTQSRSSPALQEAVEFVRGGVLGPIKYALGTCYKPRLPIGKLKKPLKIPAEVDYDLWCGPAKKVDLFRPRMHYDWHWDFNTGNGDTGNQGIHQMDIARWFLGEQTLAPRTLSIGGRVGYEDAGNTPNTQIVFHDFEKAPLIFETRGLPKSKKAQKTEVAWSSGMDSHRGSQIGVIIQCEEGHIVVPSYTEATAYDGDGKEINTWNEGGDHFTNWVQAVLRRDESLLNANILEGHLSSALCHLGNVSHRLGKPSTQKVVQKAIGGNKLFGDSFKRMAKHLKNNGIAIDIAKSPIMLGKEIKLDPSTESSSDEQVSAMLRRKCRAGFEIPDLSPTAVAS